MGSKTFKYRLHPSTAQEERLFQVLNVCRAWYNMCLAERRYAWELESRSVSKNDQLRQVKHYKRTFPQAQDVHSHCLQVATDELDKAFHTFFRRVKAGETPGYPRFKSRDRFHSIGLKEYGNGFKLDGRRLWVSGVGRILVRWHRPLEGAVKTVRVVHKAGRWWACFACEVEDQPPLPQTGRAIGIDLGLSALLTTSEGEQVEQPRFYRDAQTRLRVLQRSLQRKQKGAKNRRKALVRVQRWHEHIGNQRRDFAHKLTTALVRQYDLIALEDLRVANMARSKTLSKRILDAGWSMFRALLTNKAGDAGRQLVFVNPAYTSRACSGCGMLFQDFDLSVRWVTCGCGVSLDRDHNAAVNILNQSGWDAPVSHNVAPLSAPSGTGKRKRAAEATPVHGL